MANVGAVAEEASAASEQVASLSAEQLDVGGGMVRGHEQIESKLQSILNGFAASPRYNERK